MRIVNAFNDAWQLVKGEQTQTVQLPHCFNQEDGQGNGTMFRGEVCYKKVLTLSNEQLRRELYLEVGGATNMSQIYVNGTLCGESRCGFAMRRYAISPYVHEGDNLIEIKVSNAPSQKIYPAMADFSFYGGLYRYVKVIEDEDVHFSEDDGLRDGIILQPVVNGEEGKLHVLANVVSKSPCTVLCKVQVLEKSSLTQQTLLAVDGDANVEWELAIPQVHRWNGLKDPYLYTVIVTIERDGKVLDERTLQTGFREVAFDKERGLLLNGNPYQLKGVARHQDFGGKGNAITMRELQKDLELILEVGANAVRCSHYQHCDDWYTLCDQVGLLVWAEVPVISAITKNPDSDANAMEQLELLIGQARNHTSIFCWGVQNEVCMVTKNDYAFALVNKLAQRAKTLDPSRMTAQANEYTTEDDCPITYYTDICGFNLYYGWYYGEMTDLDARLQGVMKVHSQNPVILTEYGVDTNPAIHSADPKRNDYSEEYQVLFSDNALKTVKNLPTLAGSFVWTMFDFGSASRDEGGKKGQNQKGIVTIDRSLKKDAYYVYKAHWSEQKFIYIGGRRFVNRVGEKTTITVMSNVSSLTLKVGDYVATKTDITPVCTFEDIPLSWGENVVTVQGEGYQDTIVINRVEEEDASYKVPVKQENRTTAVNWFENVDVTELTAEAKPLRPEGYSLQDSVADIYANEASKAVFLKYFKQLTESSRFDLASPVTVERLLGFARVDLPEKIKIQINNELNAIDK